MIVNLLSPKQDFGFQTQIWNIPCYRTTLSATSRSITTTVLGEISLRKYLVLSLTDPENRLDSL